MLTTDKEGVVCHWQIRGVGVMTLEVLGKDLLRVHLGITDQFIQRQKEAVIVLSHRHVEVFASFQPSSVVVLQFLQETMVLVKDGSQLIIQVFVYRREFIDA